MGIWDSVKNAAERTKIRGDVALSKRGIETRKKKFGVEFYNTLSNDKQKLLGVSAGTLSVFKNGGQDASVREAFEKAREEIRVMQARKDQLQQKLDVMEIKGSHTMPDATVGQKVSKTGKMFSDAGTGTKVRAQMALIEREMKIRKEEFGLEVYDLTQSTEDKGKKGMKGTISKALSGLSEQEKEIQKVVDQTKRDVAEIEGKVRALETRGNFLDSELKPLAN